MPVGQLGLSLTRVWFLCHQTNGTIQQILGLQSCDITRCCAVPRQKQARDIVASDGHCTPMPSGIFQCYTKGMDWFTAAAKGCKRHGIPGPHCCAGFLHDSQFSMPSRMRWTTAQIVNCTTTIRNVSIEIKDLWIHECEQLQNRVPIVSFAFDCATRH